MYVSVLGICRNSLYLPLKFTVNIQLFLKIILISLCVSNEYYFSYTHLTFSHNLFIVSGGSDGKESACDAGDLGSIPGLGRSPGGAHSNSLQYSCLKNPHRQRSLVGYCPWVHNESDLSERLSTQYIYCTQYNNQLTLGNKDQNEMNLYSMAEQDIISFLQNNIC